MTILIFASILLTIVEVLLMRYDVLGMRPLAGEMTLDLLAAIVPVANVVLLALMANHVITKTDAISRLSARILTPASKDEK